MARGSYDLVLETRHLLGVFFAAVLLCALFFTLGFVVGRNQERSAARSAELKARAGSEPASPVETKTPASSTPLGFYERVDAPKPSVAVARTEAPKPTAKTPAKPATESRPAATQASRRREDSIALQVAALTQKDDAERLRGELQRLGFPVVIAPPTRDRFYRVQVGPFTDRELAAAAQRRLEAQGYSVLVKH